MARRNGKQKSRRGFLDVMILILSIVFAISVVITLHSFQDVGSVYSDREESLYGNLSIGDYVTLASRYYDTGLRQDKIKKNLMEYYETGLYFEDVFYAHAYEAAGLAEKASARVARAEERIPAMGEYAAEAEKIDALFR